MLHEVSDPARPPAQVPLQALPHYTPAKPRSIANGRIRFLYTQNALLNDVKHLSIERGLESVRYVPGKFLSQVNRFLPDRRIKFHRALDSFGRCLSSSNHFDQWNDVWRIKGMPEDRKSTRLNSSHVAISYAVFCLKKKT